MTKYKNKSKAFTLIEISIVLVIVGLIIGGVLVGQQLIFLGTVKKNVTEMQNYKAITEIFKDRYGSLPGAYSRASSVLGCTPAGSVPTGCDGNGIAFIDPINGTSGQTSKVLQTWHHLYLAKLIDRDYGGVYTVDNQVMVDVNVPASSIKPGGYYMHTTNFGNYTIYTYTHLILGTDDQTNVLGGTVARTPEFAKAIDDKMDDGLPKVGRIAADGIGCLTADAGSASTYIITTTNPLCRVAFAMFGIN